LRSQIGLTFPNIGVNNYLLSSSNVKCLSEANYDIKWPDRNKSGPGVVDKNNINNTEKSLEEIAFGRKSREIYTTGDETLGFMKQ
jgi:hypothetical protein